MSILSSLPGGWRRTLRVLCVAAVPLGLLAACGGGSDAENRLNVNDPKIRFVHAAGVAGVAPDVTLYRNDASQPDARDVGFGFISDYFDVGTNQADWSVRTATTPAVTLDTVTLDPSRGNLYTFVAVADGDSGVDVKVVRDPYSKSLLSNEARVRVFNAATNADAIDLYLTRSGDTVANSDALVSGVTLNTAGPASGDNSKSVDSGTWRLTLTNAGGETSRFRSSIELDDNDDVLFVVVDDPDSDTALRVLMKVDDQDPVELEQD